MIEEGSAPTKRIRNRQSRGRGLRKTTGCITCRKRHVKCDEGKPICTRCLKINQPCVYGGSREVNMSRIEESTQVQNHSTSNALTYEPPKEPALPGWQQRSPEQAMRFPQALSETGSGVLQENQNNKRPRTNSHSDYVMGSIHSDSPNQQVVSPERISGYAPTPYSIGSNDSLIQRQAFQPTFNVAIAKWFEMLVGDAAFEDGLPGFGVELDSFNGLPPSLHQEGSNNVPPLRTGSGSFDIPTQQGDSPASSSPQLLERNPLGLDAASEKLRWQAPDVIELAPHEKAILKIFVQRISHWIDLFDPSQSFSTFVPHLAMRNIGLMKAILALSTRHLSQNPGIAGEKSHDRNDALQYYNETLHYISKAMQYDSYKASLELLATALIVSTYEMIDGSGKDWERHLQGVFWIQRSQVIHGDSKGLRQAVWWAWLCQDVWAAFREKRKTFTFWKPPRTYDALNPYELAARSVYLMAQVVSYCSREESNDPIVDITARINKADRLSNMLEDWKRHLTTEFTPLPFDEDDPNKAFRPIWIHPPAFGVSLQVHYSARLLLLLNKPSRGGFGGYLEQGRLIAQYVGNICGIGMTLNDHASSVMSSQCLFIAGMCVQEAGQRQAVLHMIDLCRKRTGWPLNSLSEELQAFWEAPENG